MPEPLEASQFSFPEELFMLPHHSVLPISFFKAFTSSSQSLQAKGTALSTGPWTLVLFYALISCQKSICFALGHSISSSFHKFCIIKAQSIAWKWSLPVYVEKGRDLSRPSLNLPHINYFCRITPIKASHTMPWMCASCSYGLISKEHSNSKAMLCAKWRQPFASRKWFKKVQHDSTISQRLHTAELWVT